MKKLNEKELRATLGGKKKKCGSCGDYFRTKFTWNNHYLWYFMSYCKVYTKAHPW